MTDVTLNALVAHDDGLCLHLSIRVFFGRPGPAPLKGTVILFSRQPPVGATRRRQGASGEWVDALTTPQC
jgi:hypothetical protein